MRAAVDASCDSDLNEAKTQNPVSRLQLRLKAQVRHSHSQPASKFGRGSVPSRGALESQIPNVAFQERRCEVESRLIVPADRPSFSLFGDPDSVRPTDRLAARSAAKQNLSLFGSEDPTDRPSFIARGGSETFSRRFSLFYPTDRPSSDRPHRIGAPDRPTLPQAELGR